MVLLLGLRVYFRAPLLVWYEVLLNCLLSVYILPFRKRVFFCTGQGHVLCSKRIFRTEESGVLRESNVGDKVLSCTDQNKPLAKRTTSLWEKERESFIIIINPLTARVVGAPQMILQPVFSIFPCSPLPSGTCRTPGLSIP